MEKSSEVVSLEKIITFKHEILRKSPEQITEGLQSVPRYLMEKHGHDARTRLGQKFLDEAMKVVDAVMLAEVNEVLQTS